MNLSKNDTKRLEPYTLELENVNPKNSEEIMLFHSRTNQELLFPERENIEKNPDNIEKDISKPIFVVVLKAIEKFKSSILYSSKSSMREKVGHFINDLSHFPQPKPISEKKNVIYVFFLIKLQYLFKKIKKFPVFDPYSNERLLWDVLNLIIITFFMFWLPFELCFVHYLDYDVYLSAFFVFFIDIFVNMNTGYLINGYLIKNRKEIFSYYFKNFFFADLISIFPLLVSRPDLKYFDFLKLIILFFNGFFY